MKLLQELLLVLALLLLGRIGEATVTTGTDTTIGTETAVGTETLPIKPYITQVKILPSEAIIVAGEQVIFNTEVIWNDNITRRFKPVYTSDKGSMTNNIFVGTQAGVSVVTVTVNGKQAQTKVIIKPDKLHTISMFMKEQVIKYGVFYPKDFFGFKGHDKYGNEVPLSNVEFKLSKKTVSHLSGWVGETAMPVLNTVVKAGVVFNTHILFFDTGDYVLLVTVDKTVQTTFDLKVVLDRFENVVAWSDYRVIDIDFDEGKVIVEYNFAGTPAIQSHFVISNEWQKQFRDGNIVQRLQVLCWVHYRILEERARLLKDLEYQQFKNLLLKPLMEKVK